MGSAVAHALFKSGYAVLIHDSPRPSATRRKMSFCDAIFDGRAVMADVTAERIDNLDALPRVLGARQVVPATTEELEMVLSTLQPEVLVDARMRKHQQPESQIVLAPLTIGLGPNFVAGETVHAAIETGWNDDLGTVIWQGAPRPLEGEPQTIAGHARDRYVYAPVEGVFRTGMQVGELVSAGQEIARVDDIPLLAPIEGILRGLTHDGVPVGKKAKVIEVDPRGKLAQISGIAERPGRIAAGVLEAIRIRYA